MNDEHDPDLLDLQPGYAMTPEWILFGGFSSRAVHLYGVLKRYARTSAGAFPGRDRLRHDLRDEHGPVSFASVDRALRELAARQAIHVRRRGRGRTNVYALAWARPRHESSPVTSLDRNSRVGTGDDSRVVTGDDSHMKGQNLKDTPPTPSEGGASVSIGHRELDPAEVSALGRVPEALRADVVAVFSAWVASPKLVGGSARSSRLDGTVGSGSARRTRAAFIAERLSQSWCTVEDLTAAVQGWTLSPHHRGENRTATVYDSLGLVIRDAEHVDEFVKLWQARPKVMTEADREAARAERERVEAEQRQRDLDEWYRKNPDVPRPPEQESAT